MVDGTGSVYTVGANHNGQLGNGTFNNSLSWVQVYGVPRVKSVGTGSTNFSLALGVDGRLFGWGSNNYGQLCQPTNSGHLKTPVFLMDRVIDYAGGFGYTVVLKADGTVWWCGQLITGTTSTIPVQARFADGTPLINITDVDGGNSSIVARRDDGTVWAWGDAGLGGLIGNGSKNNSANPLQVYDPADSSGFLQNVVKVIRPAENIAIAIKADGTAWTWGTSAPSIKQYPFRVTDIDKFGNTELIRTSSGQLYSYGVNSLGQAGRTECPISCDIGQVSSLPRNLIQVSAGRSHSFAVDGLGRLYAWGANQYGQLGHGVATGNLNSPSPVYKFGSVIRVNISNRPLLTRPNGSFVVDAGGELRASGDNTQGFLGLSTAQTYYSPGKVKIGSYSNGSIVALAGAANFQFALMDDGTVWGWGSGSGFVLGLGDSNPRHLPTKLPLNNIVAIAASQTNGFALSDDGSVYTWGFFLAAGNGGYTWIYPSKIALSNIVSIAAKGSTALALQADGRMAQWGQDQPNSSINYIPALAGGGLRAKAIDLGIRSGHFLNANGEVYSWGNNGTAVFANGSLSNSVSWAPVKSQLPSVVALSINGDTGHALDANGNLWGWGGNANGTIGNGATQQIAGTSIVKYAGEEISFGKQSSELYTLLRIQGNVAGNGNGSVGGLGTGYNTSFYGLTGLTYYWDY